VNRGFSHFYPIGKAVSAEVDQSGQHETHWTRNLCGAEYRRVNALRNWESRSVVNIEGGTIKLREATFTFAAAVIKHSSKNFLSYDLHFSVTKRIAESRVRRIRTGRDYLWTFQTKNSERGLGAMSHLAKGVVGRITL
jgi:non-canonical (house-cleaning) NTP pyrophosphatase